MRIPMGRWVLAILLAAVGIGASAQDESPAVPPWPAYYGEVVDTLGQPMHRVAQAGRDGEAGSVQHARWASTTGEIFLTLDYLSCETPTCEGLYSSNLAQIDQRILDAGGEFRSATETEVVAHWRADGMDYMQIFARLPGAVVSWVRAATDGRETNDEALLSTTRSVLDRQRTEQAQRLGPIVIGRWESVLHRQALALWDRGRMDEALRLLAQVVQSAPADYAAQMDLAERNPNPEAAHEGALVVWNGTEDADLAQRAGRLLGRQVPNLNDLPILSRGPGDLEVVLVPLPPCDIRLVETAGRLYAEHLKVPVRLARLPGDWDWGTPERVFGQREMEQAIQSKSQAPINFTGWDRERFAEALTAAADGDGPLARQRVRAFLQEAAERPGQYEIYSRLTRLAKAVAPQIGEHSRTMIVAVTGADLYSGEANYVYSSGLRELPGAVSMLSYARLRASGAGDPLESRPRLAERLAKELVPASLNQLGIPRPLDPTDPFTYSSGIDRVNQKTLTLSEPTREALERLRTAPRQP